MSDKDKDVSGNPDPKAALIRGLWEELGLTEGTGGDFAASAIKFHALALTLSHYEWALLGHIDLSQTPITMKVLQERRRGGVKDRTELDLEFDPPVYLHDLNSIANVLNGPWVPHGAINLMFSAMLVHGQSARRKLEPYLEHLT